MIVFSPERFSLVLFLRRTVWAGVIFPVAALLVLLYFWAFCAKMLFFDVGVQEERGLGVRGGSFLYESIGQGPLSLRPSHALGWVARLADELVVLAYNSRPDRAIQDAEIVLNFKQGKEFLTTSNASLIYLKETESGKGLLPSEEETALWIKPILLDSGSVLLEAGRLWGSGRAEETGQFVASLQGGGVLYSPAATDFTEVFASAQAFVQDLFIQKYGGQEFTSQQSKVVLDLIGRAGPYGLRASQGDYLLYEAGRWRVATLGELSADSAVAQVRVASERGVEIDVWDERGFVPLHFKVDVKRPQKTSFGPESLPAAVRLRTGTQVSCVMGKRRMILKQGDWLLKTQNGWRKLRSLEDLQAYVQRRLKGDLFVFDAIEKDSLGKQTLKGTLFDETRGVMQPVSVPINMDKQQNKTSRKRRGVK